MALNIKITPVTSYEQNCSLLWDTETREAVLIDVGGKVPFLADYIRENGLTLKEIWLTHGHIDHVCGVVEMLGQYEVPVIGPHHNDLFLLEELPKRTLEYAKYGFPYSPSFMPTRWLTEGNQLNVGKYNFEVLHIPGHTPGHVVFYCASEKLLIAGDTLFKESIGRTDFPRGNHQDLLNNILNKLYVLPDDVVVIPGHRNTTTIGHEKQFNPHIRG